ALRPYLRQFLSDPRVIEAPAIVRWLLVNGLIVPFRSPKSAAKYKRVWNDETGSPLLDITKRQTARLGEALGGDFRVHFAMRYGKPSIDSLVQRLTETDCRRLIAVPMFPQYSATTTASAVDALFAAYRGRRVLPSMRVISEYHDDPLYVDAVVRSIHRGIAGATAEGLRIERFIVSFHGIPIKYVLRGDPYQRQSAVTGKMVAKQMGWKKGDWNLCFQSRLGGQKWLTPYTDQTLMRLGSEGLKTVLVVQPGFTADCLETIDEIGYEGQEEFHSTGGGRLVRVPCLNDDPAFIAALKNLVEREACGWR
ncbi:MAG: ferrochelatase, partial [Planctomycetia bacterium]